MPTTMTLDGVRTSRLKAFLSGLRGPCASPLGCGLLGDDAAPPAPDTVSTTIADFTVATAGWGVLAFAASTAALRLVRAFRGK